MHQAQYWHVWFSFESFYLDVIALLPYDGEFFTIFHWHLRFMF